MASVQFEDTNSRGRSGRTPLSYYAPLRVADDKLFLKSMPGNGVPKGMGEKSEQIGYWTEQRRWRMNKGQRKDLPSNWHFYYLGTGPHADLKFRERQVGVFWVAKQGSKTEPTKLGTRNRNQQLRIPTFDFTLPDSLEIVNSDSRPASRSNSRSQSKSANQSRSNSQVREQSGNRTPKNASQKKNQQEDLVAAVREALKGLGFQQSRSSSGRSTPSRAKSPARQSKKQLDKPEWKRVPNRTENATTCFGQRSVEKNCGSASVLAMGVETPNFPRIAELIPTQAALFFGSRVSTKENSDTVEIKYHYKMSVPKTNPNLPYFLQQVNAYLDPNSDQPIPKKQKAKTEETPQLNPTAPAFTHPAVPDVELEMVDEVFDIDPLGDSVA
ncbi:nucleocapsid protein [Bat coronavirus 1B]|uniref:Nucleoprotein n=2 Tax=Orthocoronavirinae TaxID=2501931 RepID=B1PHJ2_9ALPC|nr:nucleocapsid protein [Bat coronavirus 1B]WCC61991.1 nucleocapsid phosphoprotein [Bat Coronavirus MpGD16]